MIEQVPKFICKIWGGKRLAQLKKLHMDESIGESFEVSSLPSFETSPYLKNSHLSYLIKFIDTSDDLSVQVHPDTDFAKKHENSLGKTECWIILSAEEKAGLYLGFKSGVTREIFHKTLEEKNAIEELLEFFPAKKGDFFFVPAGTVHAIGKGIFLAEVQESSGITYRISDWGRLENGKPRELHLSKASQVLNFSSSANGPSYFRHRSDLFEALGSEKLLEEESFNLDLITIDSNNSFEKEIFSLERDLSITNFSEAIEIHFEKESKILLPFSSLLLSKDSSGFLKIHSKTKASFIVVT